MIEMHLFFCMEIKLLFWITDSFVVSDKLFSVISDILLRFLALVIQSSLNQILYIESYGYVFDNQWRTLKVNVDLGPELYMYWIAVLFLVGLSNWFVFLRC